RYPITYSRDYVSTLLPHVQDARIMGNFLVYDALLLAQFQKVDEALRSCRAILNCGRSIGDEPTLISMLVRMAVNRLATKQVERTLAQGVDSEDALSTMQRELANEAEEPLLLIGARGERGLMDGAMQALQDRVLDPRMLYGFAGGGKQHLLELLRVPGMTKRVRPALLKYNNQLVEIAKLPVEQQVGRLKELQAAEQDLPELARPFFVVLLKPAGAFHRNQADLRCAVVLLALERY